MKGATRGQRLHDIVFSAGAGAVDAIQIDETRSQRIGEAGRRKPEAIRVTPPNPAGSDDDPALILGIQNERGIEVAVVGKVYSAKIRVYVYYQRIISGFAIHW